jgi:hypothetical protein
VFTSRPTSLPASERASVFRFMEFVFSSSILTSWAQIRCWCNSEPLCYICNKLCFFKTRSCNSLSNPQAAGSLLIGCRLLLIHYIHSYAPYLEAVSHITCSSGLRAGWSGSRVRFSAGAGNFSLHHCVQNGSGANPASYPMATSGSCPGSKATGAWSWPLNSI